ncbi:MAG: glycosyltransferase [Eubacteriales bacterium]
MKILITTDWYKPVINGVVTSVLNLKYELERLGHEVRILTLSQDGHQYFSEDTYYLKSFKVKIYPQARATYSLYNHFISDILNWKPDLIHSQCEWMSFYFAKLISKRCNIPIVHTYHTIYEDYTHYLFMGKKLSKALVLTTSNWAVNSSNHVITPTDKAKNLLISYGVSSPITTVPTGIDLEKYDAPLKNLDKKVLLEKYNIDTDSEIAVVIGRIAKEKNIDEILENLAKIRNEFPNLRLLIVGGGPHENCLRSKSQALNIDDITTFTGMIPQSEVSKYFKLGKVFVCASQSEAQGLTYIEALASGIPLLCKYDSCLDGVLIEKENGFFFDNLESFSKNLKILLNENENINFSKRAHISSRKFSKENFGKSIEAVYLKTLEEFKEKPPLSLRLISPLKRLKKLK